MPSPPSYNASQAHSSVPPPGVMKNFTGVPKSVVNINVTPQTRVGKLFVRTIQIAILQGNGRNYLLEMDRDGNPIDRFAMPSMIQEMQNMRLSHPEDERVMMNYEDEVTFENFTFSLTNFLVFICKHQTNLVVLFKATIRIQHWRCRTI